MRCGAPLSAASATPAEDRSPLSLVCEAMAVARYYLVADGAAGGVAPWSVEVPWCAVASPDVISGAPSTSDAIFALTHSAACLVDSSASSLVSKILIDETESCPRWT